MMNNRLTKDGSGSITLSGICAYSSTTTVNAGTLNITGDISSSSSASVLSGATLSTTDISKLPSTVSLNSGATLALNISGTSTISTNFLSGSSGNFQKQGTGTLTLSGTNSYTGTTTVSAGTLVVTGTINSSSTSTVASGATLKGTGTIGPAIINGIMQPGTSIGTIEVVGNYTQSTGSTLTIEISPSATSKVNITGGSATIQSGATLLILPQAGSYTPITHVFLEADGGVTGTFDTVTIDTTNFAGAVTHSINYTATQAQIVLSGMLSAAGGGVPLTGDTALLALTSDLSTRISRSQMGLITAVQDQRFLQNEICCIAPKDCFEEPEEEEESATDNESHAKRRACDGLEFAHPYVVFDYSRADINQRKNMLPGKDYLKAVIAGCDFRVFDDLVLGGAVNYTDGWGVADNQNGKISSNSYSLAAYFQARAKGNIYVDGAVNYGKSYYETKRSQSGYYVGKFHGYDFSSQLRFLYQSYFTKVSYRPYISLSYFLQQTGNYTERRQGNNRLVVGKDHFDFFELEFGLAFWAPFEVSCWTIAPQLSVAYVRGYLRKPHDVPVHFASTPTNGSVRIANITDKQWKILAGLSAHTTHCTEIFVNYEALFDDAYDNYQEVKAGIQKGF